MRALVHLLLAAALLAPQAATAQSWRHVTRSTGTQSGPSETYIDTTRFTRDGDRVQYWQRSVLERERGKGAGRYNEMIVHMEADCRALSYRPMRIIAAFNGSEVASDTVHVEPVAVAPGTAGDRILRAACAL